MFKPFRSLIAVSALALTVAIAPAYAQQAAPVAELVKTVNIPYQQFKLDNGLTVIVHEDRKAPIVAVSIWYDVGSKHEPKGKTGYAHLFEHIMFNGSENAKGDYFEYLKKLGATDFNGTTWFDRTNYFQTVPKAGLEGALFLESDRMGHLLNGITQEKLTNQIGVVQNEKRQGDNQPYGLVEYKQIEMLMPTEHPYGHSTIGSMADLQAASLDDMKKWFTDHYGPNNAILVLAGDINVAEARPLVEKWFGDIARGPQVAKLNPPLPTLDAVKVAEMKDKVPTARLYRFWSVPGLNDPDFAALDVAATVLGGLASSRLDNILVREEQTAVAVTASTLPFVHGSVFEAYVDVKPGADIEAVSKRFDEILADFIAKGPTADEVQRVATREAAGRIAGLEQVGGFTGKAVTLAEGALYSNDPAFYKTQLERLAAMTPEKVTAATTKWLTRPVAKLHVLPGERDAYADDAGGSGGQAEGDGPAMRAPLPRTGVLAAPAFYSSLANDAMAAGAASKQPLAAVDRTTFPEAGAVPDLDFPDVEEATLSNGIKVRFARRSAVPVVRVAVSFDAGYASDPKDALGTNSLMIALLKEGTRTLNSIQLAEAQERLGTNINATSDLDRTIVSMSAMKPNLGASLDLLADVIRNPAFDAKELERVRVQQLTRIQAEFSEPQGIALRNLPPLLYGASHPYGVPLTGTGDPAVVTKLTRDQLAAYHSQWMRPERASIFVVGDTTLKDMLPMLEQRFGKWPSNRMALMQKDFSAAIPAGQGRIILIDRPNSPQSLILAGQVLNAKGTDNLLALETANDIMGGDFLSRINMDLRETKGWSYGSRSLIQRPKNDVPFLIFAPVQTNQTGPSVSAIIDQMNGFIGDKGVTPEELDRTVKGSSLELAGTYERSSSVLSQMQSDALYGRPTNYAESLAAQYRSMDAAKLNGAMREALDPKTLTWLIVGDAAKIEDQLKALNMPIEVRRAAPAAGDK
ncbi:M16 family metallopeptidase [Blastomonas fulva]|uniref:M16 family metallopeptidase n=1 Tax=Blastomonas fulva TaxID=1550728 RepID=UPI003F711633